ncbi:hypothetical protein DD238_005361 [Peronospora effusa]|uniref:Uncharacterized protein n=1 Tax=Peronospora effusa TaxID=542832 RepID=A0A3M6VD20_9STRA|nr:hypothetical protein DD238_005361 [Peronospora effusa]
MEIPATLDDALLLHSLMALVGVTIAQFALLIGIAVWMMRQNLVKMLLPLTKGRLSREVIVLSAIEHTSLVAGFSYCPVHTNAIVIDMTAFTLTTMTVFVQAVVILSTKYVVLHCFDSDMSGTFVRTQQRGEKLLESLWQDIDHFEPEQLLAGFAEASNKKKVKSKALASTKETKSKICNNTSSELTQHTQQSILNEPRVQLAILVLIQMLLLMFQLLLSAFVLDSWEMIRYTTPFKPSFAVI